MSSLMLLVKTCGCKEPLPNIWTVEELCPVCGKKEKRVLHVECGKCGHIIINKQVLSKVKVDLDAVPHTHSDAEWKALIKKFKQKRKPKLEL